MRSTLSTYRPPRTARIPLLLGTIAALLAAACGRDQAASGPGDTLTRSEALELAAAMSLEAFGQLGTEATTQAAPGGGISASVIPVRIEHEFTHQAPCPLGGSVTVSGDLVARFDLDTRTGAVDLNATQVHDACRFRARGQQLTVSGNPNITVEAHFVTEQGRPVGEQTVDITGSFRWTAQDGREGTCEVRYDAVLDPAAKTHTVDGAFCGHTITQVTRWS